MIGRFQGSDRRAGNDGYVGEIDLSLSRHIAVPTVQEAEPSQSLKYFE
jgi:hypothetical protein